MNTIVSNTLPCPLSRIHRVFVCLCFCFFAKTLQKAHRQWTKPFLQHISNLSGYSWERKKKKLHYIYGLFFFLLFLLTKRKNSKNLNKCHYWELYQIFVLYCLIWLHEQPFRKNQLPHFNISKYHFTNY